jgi:internalin A
MLGLRNTRVTDAGLLHLAQLTELKTLDLGDTRIAGAGFVHMVELLRVEQLVLRNTPVTDASVGNLGRLTGLRDLDLAWTRLTEKRSDRTSAIATEFTDPTLISSNPRFQTPVSCT